MKLNHIIFDMDGVLYLGLKPIKGAKETIEYARKNKLEVSFLTNNATRSRKTLAQKLNQIGIEAHPKEIMCSSYAAAHYVSKLNPKPKTAYIIGESGLKKELQNKKISLLNENQCKNKLADIFVIGLDRKLTYQKLEIAFNHIMAGKKFIACNLDHHYPWTNGFKPGGGCAIAALSFATGEFTKTANKISSIKLREPDFVVGKPNTYMLDLLLKNKSPKNTALIGDRLDMDIELANKKKLYSILTLTGVTKKHEAKNAKGVKRPKAILNSIGQLPEFLDQQ